MRASLSLSEARRVALAAQGFDRARPKRATFRHLRDTIRRLGLLQIDSVAVVCPAHYMVPFSRLGPYDRAAFDQLIYRSGEFAEHWAHEISIVPPRDLASAAVSPGNGSRAALGIFKGARRARRVCRLGS